MQNVPLTLGRLLEPMERQLAGSLVTEHRAGADPVTVTFRQVADRARRLAAVLDDLGVGEGARVATLASNSQAHLELFVAVPASGRVLHTVNHRLFHEQLAYVIDHAEDEVLFVEQHLLDAVRPVLADRKTVRWIVVVDARADDGGDDDPRVLDYEDLIERQERRHPLDFDDEDAASALCYTSGTTGDPKGVLYSHRSTVLHTLLLLGVDSFGVGEEDTVLPIVPMFHVNAWGLPYAALLTGADLVLPGTATRPDLLVEQMRVHGVTITGAVPAVWRSMVPHLEHQDLALRKAVCGGGPIPADLWDALHARGITLTGAWGMTETSPLVTNARPPATSSTLTPDELRAAVSVPGQPLPLMSLRVVADDGQLAPWDGASPGELQIQGPTIAAAYYRSGVSATTSDGWLRTGDVATVDPAGTLRILDRAKDLIKSGGEWISSIDLEEAIMSHPGVDEAVVVGVPDERWEERPVAWIVESDNMPAPDDESLRDHLRTRIASWWMPDRFVRTSAIPKTGTGKPAKAQLRQRLLDEVTL